MFCAVSSLDVQTFGCLNTFCLIIKMAQNFFASNVSLQHVPRCVLTFMGAWEWFCAKLNNHPQVFFLDSEAIVDKI